MANKPNREAKLLQADIVIQFGSRFISKRINQFLAEFQGEFWVVEQSQNAVDPNHHTQTRFNAKAHHWLRAHPPLRQKLGYSSHLRFQNSVQPLSNNKLVAILMKPH